MERNRRRILRLSGGEAKPPRLKLNKGGRLADATRAVTKARFKNSPATTDSINVKVTIRPPLDIVSPSDRSDDGGRRGEGGQREKAKMGGWLVFSGIRVGERERREGKGEEGEILGGCRGRLLSGQMGNGCRERGERCMHSVLASVETTHHTSFF